MKYFIACLGTETNTFSPIPTGISNFADTMLCRGDGSVQLTHPIAQPLQVWQQMAKEKQYKVIESLSAFAEPAGVTVKKAYEDLRDEILGDLQRELRVDAVLLSLHGAMVADGYQDCEGDLLEQVRRIVGPNVVVGAELDLHSHITEKMIQNANVLITYKEYPHTDYRERAEELFTICTDAAMGKVLPCISSYDCRMIAKMPTSMGAIRDFIDHMQTLEKENDVLSVSLNHGFVFGDVPDVGTKILVITNNNELRGKELVKKLGTRLWSIRNEVQPNLLSIDEAIDRALILDKGPVVLADVSDNAGGGAPNDATYILKRLLERSVQNVVCANYWDPIAVRFCMDAGEGASLDLRIGGKSSSLSGQPVDMHVTVKKIVEDGMQTFNGFPISVGSVVWVAAEGIDLILNTKRFQTGNPDLMTQLGLDPSERHIIVVKSAQHFYSGFAPIAKEIIYVAAPGVTNPDTANIPFKNLSKPYWPRVDDPFLACDSKIANTIS